MLLFFLKDGKRFSAFFIKTVLCSICTMHVLPGIAQSYKYTQYTTPNGLVGSTVYGIKQDSNGFIWFATETGLSRFDGVRFKNFTVNDGLPANEVIGITPDSKGRIWLILFSKEVCYYKAGKIYNASNDPLLRRIKIKEMIRAIYETPDGNILITTDLSRIVIHGDQFSYVSGETYDMRHGSFAVSSFVTKYTADDVHLSDLPAGIHSWMSRVKKGFTVFRKTAGYPDRSFFVITGDTVFVFKDSLAKSPFQKFFTEAGSFICLDENEVAFKKPNGFLIYNVDERRIKFDFVLPCMVNEVFKDIEGEYWFSTNGQGAFKLASPSFETYSSNSGGINFPVLYLGKDNGILAGNTKGDYQIYDTAKHRLEIKKRVTFSDMFPERRMTGIYQQVFHKIDTKDSCVRKLTVKTIMRYGDTLLVAAASGVFLVSASRISILKTISNERATCALKWGNDYYVGTLSGLVKIDSTGKQTMLGGLDKRLYAKISFLAQDKNNILWAATYANGIVGIRNEKFIAAPADLSGKICNTLFVYGDHLWVGTENGMDKIELHSGAYRKTAAFNALDGIASNTINCIFEDDRNVYAGTPSGLTVFRKNTVIRSVCLLSFTAVIVSGKPLVADSGPYSLSHQDNNIRFEFSGISFRSGDRMIYHYKLEGLDTNWRSGSEPVLSYPSLPSGNYEMKIIAENRFGQKSNELVFTFAIGKSIWEEIWVQLAGIFMLAAAVFAFIRFRTGQIKKKSEQKLNTEKQITALEQMALRAQMNPHFIFNCLNSIQNFIIKNDAKGANKYLNRFASLIRQTLENSARIYITVAEEILYLSNYIELERLQTGNGFDFEIKTGTADYTKIMIPNMILQPYVENAIKHGTGSCLYGVPRLEISFKVENKVLICVINDNGAGIDHSQKSGGAHLSRGMSITDRRIQTINLISAKDPVIVKIKDRSKEQPPCSGTSVTLHFPL